MTYLQCWKGKKKNTCKPRISYLAKLSFKVSEKLRPLQVDKSWESSLPLDLPYKKCFLANERMIDGTLKSCEEIKISSKDRSVQLLSHVQLFVIPWIAAPHASLSITNSQSLLRLMPIESVMPSSQKINTRAKIKILL